MYEKYNYGYKSDITVVFYSLNAVSSAATGSCGMNTDTIFSKHEIRNTYNEPCEHHQPYSNENQVTNHGVSSW